MRIVADSTPLIHLAAMGDFDLLRKMFGRVSVPPAVFREVVVEGTGRPGDAEVRQASREWLTVAGAVDQVRVGEIMRSQHLHAGEAEVIVLAEQLLADAVVMDDRSGVEYARTRGLDVVRTPALYVTAKRRGLIDAVQPRLDRLRAAGFRLTDKDYAAVLQIAAER